MNNTLYLHSQFHQSCHGSQLFGYSVVTMANNSHHHNIETHHQRTGPQLVLESLRLQLWSAHLGLKESYRGAHLGLKEVYQESLYGNYGFIGDN